MDEFDALEDNGYDEKRNEQDEKDTLLKSEDYDYNGGEPDNNDDDNIEDEEESPLEYDGSDLEDEEDNGNYDDEEQDYWDVDSEKELENKDEEKGNERDGESNEGILIYREVVGMSPRMTSFSIFKKSW